MNDAKCASCASCENDANAIFADGARGLYTPLCAAHLELEKKSYEARMDQYAIVGLPSEEPAAPPVDELRAALEHQEAVITTLEAEIARLRGGQAT